MKKIVSVMLVLAMMLSLASCAQQAAPAATTPAPAATTAAPAATTAAPAAPQIGGDFNIGGGSSGGVYYAMSTTFSQFFNDVGGLGQFTAYPTTGTGQNLAFMKSGEIEIGVIAAPIGADALNGVNDWVGKQYDGLRAIAFLYGTYIQFFPTPGSGIKTLADIKGKKVAVGAAGGGDQFIMRKILAAMDMTFDDFKPEYVGAADSVELLRDGHLDAAPGFTNIPWSTMVELTNAGKVGIMGIEDAVITKLTTGADAQFFPLTIPAGTYKGQEKDVNTVGMGTILCIDSGVSDDQVYAMTKAIYTNAKDLSARHASIANIAPEQVSQIKGIPLHSGAEKYYKEVGALK